MQLKGSKTHDNLKAAFAGESQANRRYLYFAAKADVEGQNVWPRSFVLPRKVKRATPWTPRLPGDLWRTATDLPSADRENLRRPSPRDT